jgi:enamine deaminase RidA (YjgF/YER057c/UK114 family)
MTKKALLPPEDSKMFQASRAGFQKFGYSPGVVAGGLLFIAGQVGIRPDGTVAESLTEQFEVAMKRTVEILSWEGLTLADLVEVVSYHVDLKNNLPEFLEAKPRFTEKPYPAWSIIGIDALARPEFKIEIRSVAALRK